MYRIVTDFHGGWYGWGGLQQAIFIAGNFTAAGLNGKNGTFPDNDMLPLSAKWWSKAGGAGGGGKGWTPEEAARGQTIMTLDIISRSPLMHAGTLLKATKPDNSPAPLLKATDPTTLNCAVIANSLAPPCFAPCKARCRLIQSRWRTRRTKWRWTFTRTASHGWLGTKVIAPAAVALAAVAQFRTQRRSRLKKLQR